LTTAVICFMISLPEVNQSRTELKICPARYLKLSRTELKVCPEVS
jgi:hypothetical protein